MGPRADPLAVIAQVVFHAELSALWVGLSPVPGPGATGARATLGSGLGGSRFSSSFGGSLAALASSFAGLSTAFTTFSSTTACTLARGPSSVGPAATVPGTPAAGLSRA